MVAAFEEHESRDSADDRYARHFGVPEDTIELLERILERGPSRSKPIVRLMASELRRRRTYQSWLRRRVR